MTTRKKIVRTNMMEGRNPSDLYGKQEEEIEKITAETVKNVDKVSNPEVIPKSMHESMQTGIQEISKDAIKKVKHSIIDPRAQLSAQFRRRNTPITKNLSSRIDGDIWDWLNMTFRGTGISKVELIEQALLHYLPDEFMPEPLKSK